MFLCKCVFHCIYKDKEKINLCKYLFVTFFQAICVGPETLQVMYPAIFEQLLQFVEFSCKPPQYGKMETKHVANAKYNQVSELFL